MTMIAAASSSSLCGRPSFRPHQYAQLLLLLLLLVVVAVGVLV